MSKNIRRFLIACVLSIFVLGGSSAFAGTIDFAGLAGVNGDLFTNYTVLGFTVSSTGGTWYQALLYGDPTPDIYAGPKFDSTSPDTITVAMTGGGTFVFESLRLSANNGSTDYTITGTDNGNPVYTQTGTVFNTNLAFATITSTDLTSVVTLLTISLSSSGGGTTSYNIDNIVVSQHDRPENPPEPPDQPEVPEPATLGLTGLAVAALGLARKMRG
jgi:hypothetical protein